METFDHTFRGGMKEQAPISDIYISDSSSTSSSGISEASQLRSGDSGGREDVGGRPQRGSSWHDGLDLRGADLNGDGNIDKVELAVSKTGQAITNEIRLLHPLIAKGNRHPNFLRTQIEQKRVEKESHGKRGTQVNLVQQGEANFMKDFNQFNVNF